MKRDKSLAGCFDSWCVFGTAHPVKCYFWKKRKTVPQIWVHWTPKLMPDVYQGSWKFLLADGVQCISFFLSFKNKHRKVQRVIEQIPSQSLTPTPTPKLIASRIFSVAMLLLPFSGQVGSTHSTDKSDSTWNWFVINRAKFTAVFPTLRLSRTTFHVRETQELLGEVGLTAIWRLSEIFTGSLASGKIP